MDLEQLSIEDASPDMGFPWRLYLLLRDSSSEFPEVMGWLPCGKVFQIHDPEEMERSVLKRYFTSSKYSSFRRQLIAYGFTSLGNRKYLHEEFNKGNQQGCEKLVRFMKSQPRKGKGKGKSAKQSEENCYNNTQTALPQPPQHVPQGWFQFPSPSSFFLFSQQNKNSNQQQCQQEQYQQQQQRYPPSYASPPNATAISSDDDSCSYSQSAASHSHSCAQSQGEGRRAAALCSDTVCSPDLTSTSHSTATTRGASASTRTDTGSTSSGTNASIIHTYATTATCMSPLPEDEDFDDLDIDFEPIPFTANQATSTSENACTTTTNTAYTVANAPPPSQQQDSQEQLMWQQLWKDCLKLQPRTIQEMMTEPTQILTATAAKLLEPRPIPEMLLSPSPVATKTSVNNTVNNNWFQYTPHMTPEFQQQLEYGLPLVLPLLFYTCLENNTYSQYWAFALAIGHAIECMCTNFGGNSWYYKDWIGPIQHLQWDMILNHAMISAFLLEGPNKYGPNCYWVALGLIPTLPTVLAVDLKSHFVAFVMKEQKKQQDLIPKMARHIRRSTLLYSCIMMILAVSSFYGTTWTQAAAVFVFNVCPMIVDVWYFTEFESQLDTLPASQRTAIPKRYVDRCNQYCNHYFSMEKKTKVL